MVSASKIIACRVKISVDSILEIFYFFLSFPENQGLIFHLPASVAQLNAHLIGDQEVAGLTPAGWATFFHGD